MNATKRRKPMSEPRPCNRGCGTQVVIAKSREGDGPYLPYEALVRDPGVPGCVVIVAGQAWNPAAYVEHFAVTHEIDAKKARDVVDGFLFHRAHRCDPRPERHDD